MKTAPKLNKLGSQIATMIYPWLCSVCGGRGDKSGICVACKSHLPWCQGILCSVCGLPLSGHRDANLVCGECQKSPPDFDHLNAVLWYQSPIDKLITDYKYFSHWENAHTLVELVKSSFVANAQSGLIIPVPSHPVRIRQRGFNAVYELIKQLKSQVKFDYDLQSVCRRHNTEIQTGKLKGQRRKNVKGAFKIIKPILSEHVILFDEVVTTGATVNELSRCLKKSGVKQVSVWAIARTK